jgi:hypothetical protein
MAWTSTSRTASDPTRRASIFALLSTSARTTSSRPLAMAKCSAERLRSPRVSTYAAPCSSNIRANSGLPYVGEGTSNVFALQLPKCTGPPTDSTTPTCAAPSCGGTPAAAPSDHASDRLSCQLLPPHSFPKIGPWPISLDQHAHCNRPHITFAPLGEPLLRNGFHRINIVAINTYP